MAEWSSVTPPPRPLHLGAATGLGPGSTPEPPLLACAATRMARPRRQQCSPTPPPAWLGPGAAAARLRRHPRSSLDPLLRRAREHLLLPAWPVPAAAGSPLLLRCPGMERLQQSRRAGLHPEL